MSGAGFKTSFPIYDSMEPSPLVGGAPADLVLGERLDHSRLDFSLGSLQLIDDYLNEVHAHEQTSLGSSLLSTIEFAAHYVGEIIRRLATARDFEWVTVGVDLPEGGGSPPCQAEIGTVRALRAHDGEMCLPNRAVLRVILRGRKARSMVSFARGAIESTPAAAPPAPPVPRTLRRRGAIAA